MKKQLKFRIDDEIAEVDIELRERKSGLELSICGYTKHSGGQIHEDLKEVLPARLYMIWRRYHLNDVTAGTRSQEMALRKHRKENPTWKYDYDAACDVLRSKNLLVDGTYKYGSAWLYTPLPSYVLKYIESL